MARFKDVRSGRDTPAPGQCTPTRKLHRWYGAQDTSGEKKLIKRGERLRKRQALAAVGRSKFTARHRNALEKCERKMRI